MKVSLTENKTYDQNEIIASVKEHFDNFGGIEKFIKEGDNVFIKINMLMGRAPEAVTTTHPALVYAVAKLAKEAGGNVVIGDSPGGLYTKAILERSYRICGIDEVAKKAGVALNVDTGATPKSYMEGQICKNFRLIDPWHKADCYISLCKLKTHAMTGYTGAVKNNFGLIPGLEKPEFHSRYPDLTDFCTMLVDLCRLSSPDFTIMDAVIGMEGDGPSGGTPRAIGLLGASTDPFALDKVMVSAIGFEEAEAKTLLRSIEMGECQGEVEIVGDAVSFPYVENYKRASSHDITFTRGLPKFLRVPLEKMARPKPVIIKDKCIGCGECARSCPVKTIDIVDKKAVIHEEKCIKCFCCQEMCEVRAIKIKSFKLFKM